MSFQVDNLICHGYALRRVHGSYGSSIFLIILGPFILFSITVLQSTFLSATYKGSLSPHYPTLATTDIFMVAI
jgi:hypothetical protein